MLFYLLDKPSSVYARIMVFCILLIFISSSIFWLCSWRLSIRIAKYEKRKNAVMLNEVFSSSCFSSFISSRKLFMHEMMNESHDGEL